jgi:hypothetical protein
LKIITPKVPIAVSKQNSAKNLLMLPPLFVSQKQIKVAMISAVAVETEIA